MDCDATEKGILKMWKCNVHERHSLARGGGGDRLTEYWCSENISLFRARFSRSNMLLSLALLLGISTAISSLPQPWFGLFFCIFVIVDCFDLSNFYYTVKSFYTLTITFGPRRGEREWLLGVWEREWEWVILLPKFRNGKGTEKDPSQNSGTERK